MSAGQDSCEIAEIARTRLARAGTEGKLESVIVTTSTRHLVTIQLPRCSTGRVTVTAVGERALLAVVADDGLDQTAFRREIPAATAKLRRHLDEDV
ncbi:hypothetical protein ACGFY7_41255 [Streptomyces prunicolor]|uniref:hypothetical protein n=1 Tax=Streptomyces prunicolor TaxID=67348 RepID=UPI0037209424